MLPIGCGIDGYIELNPDWNGNLAALAAAIAAELAAEDADPAADGGV